MVIYTDRFDVGLRLFLATHRPPLSIFMFLVFPFGCSLEPLAASPPKLELLNTKLRKANLNPEIPKPNLNP